ncbi:MAG: hypothetical protein ACK5OX_06800 [Desertimonas sp.]
MHLPRRPASLVALAVAGGLGVLGSGAFGDTTGASAPPAESTTPTTLVLADPDSEVTPVATVPVGAVVARGGSAAGGLGRDADAPDWNVGQLATTAALGLVALGVAGHLYGRLQSTVTRPERTVPDTSTAEDEPAPT